MATGLQHGWVSCWKNTARGLGMCKILIFKMNLLVYCLNDKSTNCFQRKTCKMKWFEIHLMCFLRGYLHNTLKNKQTDAVRQIYLFFLSFSEKNIFLLYNFNNFLFDICQKYQGSRLILPTDCSFSSNYFSWSHEHNLVSISDFFLLQHGINQCMMMNFYHSL